MHVAVLLLSLNNVPRRTSFSRAWAEQCVAVAGEYYAAQSANRITITWKVYDWLALGMTEQQWGTLSSSGIDGVVDEVTPMLPQGSDLKTGVDHILVGIDSPHSSGGTTPGHFTYLGAVNFSPSFIGHEFGHRFFASDAFGTAAAGRQRYQHHFCVMGAEGWPYTYDDNRLLDPDASGLAGTGPGMSAPTLMATGWLDPGQHNLVEDLSGSADITFGTVVSLSALTGSPGMSWTGPPVAVRFGDYVVEYRVAAGWDRGIPVAAGADGTIVVNSSPSSAPVAEFVDSVHAVPGAVLALGPDNVLDLGHAGPLVIRVLSVDAANDVVHLSLSKRAARPGLGGVQIGPGGGGDGGGWVWTPGRGLQRIPPYSPLHDALTSLGDLAALHELAGGLSREDAGLAHARAVETLAALREAVGRVAAEPVPSPLHQGLDGLAALEAARRRFESDSDRGDLGRDYLEAGAAAVEQLRGLLERAVQDERPLSPG